MEAYLTANEVAEMAKVTVQTVRRYTMRNEIPFHKIFRMVRYKPSEIELWIENRKAAKPAATGGDIEGGLFDGTNGGGAV